MAVSMSKGNTQYLENINEFENKLDRMDKKVDLIYTTLVGNEALDQEGIIGRIKRIEKEIEKNKALRNKLVGAFAAGGVIYTILFKFLEHLISKS